MSLAERSAVSAPSQKYDDLRDRVAGQSLFSELARLHAKGEFAVDLEHGFVHVGPEAHSWYTGLLGERRVARILARLGTDATVLHSVPVGSKSSDIDHIVISPAGVFTITTKNHPGQPVWVAGHGMMIGGAKVSHLRNAVHEARRAEHELSTRTGLTIPVTPVVALVGVRDLTVAAPPVFDDTAVQVVREDSLLALLTGRPVFSSEQVFRIAAAAVVQETWGEGPSADPTATTLLDAFLAYEAHSSGSVPSTPHGPAPIVLRFRWRTLATLGVGILATVGLAVSAVLALT
ncbi:nuclease-related domain-containing protein [Planctomonas psychrotolerans]|uniref:nuclease-related domain-containing protein n=1 Tax=Planctomonas psychrotolerans TaxID=2528712 RepID=UPI001D0CFE3E|nr:nuclease-related domain-containing protein [Planctomonas psychrotolerans]